MNCRHESLRCTNNQFFCLSCGKELPMPPKEEIFKGAKEVKLPPLKVAGAEQEPQEPAKPAPKTARKRKAKKEGDQ